MNGLKKFFGNKNTVTVLGVIACVAVLYIGYTWRINAATEPVKIPYAKVDIQPRDVITSEMIGYMDVPSSSLQSGIVTNVNGIVGKCANYNTMIPTGSPFYQTTLVNQADLPDSAFADIPTGYTVLNFPVDLESTYGNSMYPTNYINLYLKSVDDDGKLIVGKLISNIEILDVKDSSGRHVFEDSEEARIPAYLIVALPEDVHLLVRKAMYLSNTELIPVPNTEILADDTAVSVSSTQLQEYVLSKTKTVSLDQLPTVG